MTTIPNVSNHSGLRNTNARDYVIVLDSLEFAFPKYQLQEISDAWNEGIELDDLASRYKRPMDEIFLALFHQARNGEIKRPICRRIYWRNLDE